MTDPIALQKQLYEFRMRLGGDDRKLVAEAERVIRQQFLTLCHLRSVLNAED